MVGRSFGLPQDPQLQQQQQAVPQEGHLGGRAVKPSQEGVGVGGKPMPLPQVNEEQEYADDFVNEDEIEENLDSVFEGEVKEGENLAETFFSIIEKEPEKLDDLLKATSLESLKVTLKNLLDHRKAATLNNKQITLLVNALCTRFPKLREFFAEKTHTLTPQGMREIVTYLREKNSIRVECEVCDFVDDFKEKLKELKDLPVGTKKAFMVRCALKEAPEDKRSSHRTAVYLEKTAQGWKAFQMDASQDPSFYSTLSALKEINPAVIYFGGAKRQRDSLSCPVFCLRDIAQVSRMKDIFEYLEKNTVKGKSNMVSVAINKFPKELMGITQDLSVLDDYHDKNPNSLVTSNKGVTRSLKAVAKKHTISVVNREKIKKEVNNLAQNRLLKYTSIILQKHLK